MKKVLDNYLKDHFKEFKFGQMKTPLASVLITILISPLLAVFLHSAFAATTISTDVVTGGNLQASSTLLVTGDSIFYGSQTFGNAATDINLFTGTLQASTTALFTANATFYAGGSFNAATTTDSMYIGGLLQHTGGTASATALVIGNDMPIFRSSANTLTVQGSVVLTNSGTLTVAGNTTISGALDVSGGNITLQNDETIGNSTNNNVFINSTSVSLATSTATTTRSLFVSAPAGTATTTVSLAGARGSTGSCLELYQENTAYRLYISPSTTAVSSNGFILLVEPGSCRD